MDLNLFFSSEKNLLLLFYKILLSSIDNIYKKIEFV